MKKILKVIPILAIAGAVLFNPIKNDEPKQVATEQAVQYLQADPGGGSAG